MEISCQLCLTAFPELEEIASQLRCGICYEIMKTPMITPCSHTYCSLCIRTSISFKPNCPACPSVVRDDSLKNNLALDNCIAPLLSLEKKIHELCKGGVIKGLKNLVKSNTPPKSNASPERSPETEPEPPLNIQQPRKKLQSEAKQHSQTLQLNEEKGGTESKYQAVPKNVAEWIQSPRKIETSGPQCSTISKRDIAPESNSTGRLPGPFFTSPKSTTSSPSSSRSTNDLPSSSTQSDGNKVSCPVCQVSIPERNINLHLDKCLSSQQDLKTPSPSRSKPEVPRREPLKKMVYHMMSEKEIRKKLKEYGLSVKGDRSQLINRLQRYTVLYNSECDSLQPRPIADIKRQLEREEEALNKIPQPVLKTVRISKAADPNEIEDINRQYINENKSSYDDLIRQIRERGAQKGKKEEPRNKPPTPKRTDTYNSKLFRQMRAMENEASPVAGRSGQYSKRSRISEESSDEFSGSQPSPKAAKKDNVREEEEDGDFVPARHTTTPRCNRILDDERQEIFTPKSKTTKKIPAKSQKARLRDAPSKSQKRPDRSSPDENDELSPHDPFFRPSESPVLNRCKIQDDPKPAEKRNRWQLARGETAKRPALADATTRQTRQKAEPAKVAPSRRRRTRAQGPQVRTVSRTPSLSPSRFEGFDDSSSPPRLRRSATPDLIFENGRGTESSGSRKTETESETDPENVSLSQLVSIMNRSGDSTELGESNSEL